MKTKRTGANTAAANWWPCRIRKTPSSGTLTTNHENTMQTENDTSKPEDPPQQDAGEGCSGATCSASHLTREDEIRRVIASCCGWDDFSSAPFAGSLQYGRKPGSCSASWELPEYVRDLNAMHEAEKFIRPPYWKDFSIWESYIEALEEDPHANAETRAKAFIRAMNISLPNEIAQTRAQLR